MDDAEHLLIGAIFSAPHVYHQAVEAGVTGESFSSQDASLLWRVSEKIIKDTNHLDRYSILVELRRMKHKAGMELVDSIPTDISEKTASVHIEAVRMAEKKRKMDQVIREYIRNEENPDHTIPEMAGKLMGILQSSASHRVKTFDEIAPKVQDELAKIASGKGDNIIGFNSFISQANLWGIPYPKGKPTVVAGYRNSGKSSLMKQEIVFMARQGIKCGIITMEDTDRDVFTNTVTIDGAGWMYRYQRGNGNMEQFSRHAEAIRKLPIYVIDAPQTISELETSMTLLVAKHGCDMLYIDHLHEVMADRWHKYYSIDEKYSDIMERITARQKQLDVGCCIYAQFSRDCEKEGRPPRMSDLKGSSKIEQAARRIYLFYQDAEESQRVGDKRFCFEGSKISNSGYGAKEDRKAYLKYSRDHDGFEIA